MSTNENNIDDEAEEVCASCGITGGDGIKLKKCTACKLVRYCSVACQKEHRSQHKRACKRRAAELREELLFKQPEISNLGDCPICFIPLPLDPSKSRFHECCSKVLCAGCAYAYTLEHLGEDEKCPFCRTPDSKIRQESISRHYWKKRMEANDPVAIREMGMHLHDKMNFSGAFELHTKAARLGDAEAHYQLARMYDSGDGVERDEKKEILHLEEAAIGGHTRARHNLGIIEQQRGRMERAMKHFIIAANLGQNESMEVLKEYFNRGLVKKEDLAAALYAHKAAVDAAKSPQREAAEQVQWNVMFT